MSREPSGLVVHGSSRFRTMIYRQRVLYLDGGNLYTQDPAVSEAAEAEVNRPNMVLI